MRTLVGTITAITLLLTFVPAAAADHLPKPRGYVNDFANVLDRDEETQLEERLDAYERETGNEIAIALVDDLDEGDIDDFTVRAFEEWKLGKQGEDNGVLVLAAMDDRKVRIEVGYGVEGELTDGEAGNIIRTTIAPAFRDDDHARGLTDAVGAISTELGGGESRAAREPAGGGSGGDAGSGIFGLFVFGALMLSWIGAFLARSRSIWAGGVLGAGIGAVIGASAGNAIALALGAGVLGLGLDWLLSRNYRRNHRRGVFNSWGGFYGGLGGGSSQGGFGGFGGGSSGGGGASGGW